MGYLTSQDNTETTGRLFEITGGWAAETRWQRTGGHGFPTNVILTPENVLAKWDVFTDFGACVRRALGWVAEWVGRRWPCNVSSDVGGGYGDAHGEFGQYDGRACQVETVAWVGMVYLVGRGCVVLTTFLLSLNNRMILDSAVVRGSMYKIIAKNKRKLVFSEIDNFWNRMRLFSQPRVFTFDFFRWP